MQTAQTRIEQTAGIVRTTDEAIADIQRNITVERNLLETVEQQKKDLMAQLNAIKVERASLDSTVTQLQQSKEFSESVVQELDDQHRFVFSLGIANRESDQIKILEAQIEAMKEESTQVDEQINAAKDQCKDFESQIEVGFIHSHPPGYSSSASSRSSKVNSINWSRKQSRDRRTGRTIDPSFCLSTSTVDCLAKFRHQ